MTGAKLSDEQYVLQQLKGLVETGTGRECIANVSGITQWHETICQGVEKSLPFIEMAQTSNTETWSQKYPWVMDDGFFDEKKAFTITFYADEDWSHSDFLAKVRKTVSGLAAKLVDNKKLEVDGNGEMYYCLSDKAAVFNYQSKDGDYGLYHMLVIGNPQELRRTLEGQEIVSTSTHAGRQGARRETGKAGKRLI